MNPSRDTRGLLVALSVTGAGLIHLAAVRSHLGSAAAVAAFSGVGLVQVLLGVSFLAPGARGPKRLAVTLVGAAAIAAWLVSRTWGLPSLSGHSGPERIGPADLAAAMLQLVGLALVLWPTRRTSPTAPRRTARLAVALPIVVVSALASVSLLSVPEHGHDDRPERAARVGSTSARAPGELVKRAVPAPPVMPDAKTTHHDAPRAASHSH